MSDAKRTIQLGRFLRKLDRPLIMGVVNLTADSFSDGGQLADVDSAIRHARALAGQGADILDLGAESTRPGAKSVATDEELARLLPVIDGLRELNIPISVDTRHASTMRAVLAHGADMINDVNALRDTDALAALADSDAAICLMHMQGNPLNMQHAPAYRSVVSEVTEFLESHVTRALNAGIDARRIVVDPGIGFGKNLSHNLALIRACAQIGQDCSAPVLIGASRKSMLGDITGQDVTNRLAGSIAIAVAAIRYGAAIVRVHDVEQTRDALAVWQALEQFEEN